MALTVREKPETERFCVTVFVAITEVGNVIVLNDLCAPFLARGVSIQIIPHCHRGLHCKFVVTTGSGVFDEIFPEIMRHARVIIHLLRAKHALKHFVINIIARNPVPFREIKVLGPRQIREFIKARDLAARETVPARLRACQILISHASDKLKNRILLLDAR